MISGMYFDGKNTRAHPVSLVLAHGMLHISGDGVLQHLPQHAARLSEPFAHAPCVLSFSNGARCEIFAEQDKHALLEMYAYRPGWIERLQRHWQAALVAVALMLLLLALLRAWGIPRLTEEIAQRVPLSVEQELGRQSLAVLEQNMFAASQASPQQIEAAQQVFQRLQTAAQRMPTRLLVRQVRELGPNAFTLPDGSVVVTDAMLHMLSAGQSQMSAHQQELLAAVLAHELAHLELQHSLKNVISSSLFGALSWSLLGDFSAVAASAPTLILQSEFSREMELQADAYAWRLLQARGIPSARLIEVFEGMQKMEKRQIGSQMPAWMRSSADYLATHPAYSERITRLRQAAAR